MENVIFPRYLSLFQKIVSSCRSISYRDVTICSVNQFPFFFFFALFVVHIYMYTAAVVVNMIRNDELDTLKVKVSMKHSWE